MKNRVLINEILIQLQNLEGMIRAMEKENPGIKAKLLGCTTVGNHRIETTALIKKIKKEEQDNE